MTTAKKPDPMHLLREQLVRQPRRGPPGVASESRRVATLGDNHSFLRAWFLTLRQRRPAAGSPARGAGAPPGSA